MAKNTDIETRMTVLESEFRTELKHLANQSRPLAVGVASLHAAWRNDRSGYRGDHRRHEVLAVGTSLHNYRHTREGRYPEVGKIVVIISSHGNHSSKPCSSQL